MYFSNIYLNVTSHFFGYSCTDPLTEKHECNLSEHPKLKLARTRDKTHTHTLIHTHPHTHPHSHTPSHTPSLTHTLTHTQPECVGF